MPPSGGQNSRRRLSGWNAPPWNAPPPRFCRLAEQFPTSQVPHPQQIAAAARPDVVGHQQLAVRTEPGLGMPETALVRPRQADQLAIVVEPVNDHRTRALGDGISFEGGVDAEGVDIAAVALPEGPHVGQPQGGDRVLADLGQAVPALAIATQDLRGFGEPVQAVEPLANQPGALESRAFGDQRLAECEPGLALGLRGPVELPDRDQRRHGRDDCDQHHQRCGQRRQRSDGRIAAAPAPGPLAGRASPGEDRPVGQEPLQVLGQRTRRDVPLARLAGHRLQDDRLQVAAGSSGRSTVVSARLRSQIRSISFSRSDSSNAGRSVSISYRVDPSA